MKKASLFWLFFCIVIDTFSQQHWQTLNTKKMDDYPSFLCADSNYLYMSGEFTEVESMHMQGIARWNGVKWDSLGAGIDASDAFNSNPPPAAMVEYHHKLYVGGLFTSLGRVRALGMGSWDGTKWDSLSVQPFTENQLNLGEDLCGPVAVINDKLYVAGEFDSIAGFPCNSVAYWDDTNWHSMNFPHFSSWQYLNTICAYNGSIYVGGSFAGNNGGIGEILRWDNMGWHAVDTGIKGVNGWVNTMAVYNGELYVAGNFSTADRNADNNIQRWDGTQWKAVGGGTDYEIFNLTVYNNKLYAMGQLGEAGGIPASYIAEWDGSKWCSMGSTFDNAIVTSCIYKDSLYIGGAFWTIDGDSINYIAEWTGGNYTDGCGATTAGVSEVKVESGKVKVYPNPNNGQFNLSLSNVNTGCNVEIYNVLGQPVYSQLNIENSIFSIDLSSQSNGVYMYRVYEETGNLVGQGKLLIQR
jgi:hypothetical protein